MSKILSQEHSVLRATAANVPEKEFNSAALKELVQALSHELSKEKHGVAIAAPQIGVSKRVFLVAGHVYAHLDEAEYSKEAYPDKVFINPVITSRSKDMREMHEGCLSVRARNATDILWGYVPRSRKVRVRAYDSTGRVFEVGASELLAQIFQHEVDHLDGILYVDRAVSLHEEPDLPEKE